MLLVDLIIIVLTLAVAVWGYREGLSTGGLALIGFGAGAILGSRVAPLILDGGFEDPFAPVLALPAALIFGAIVAAILERFGFGLRRRLRRRGKADAAGGALLAACLGLVAVWILGAAAARVDTLRDPVRDSEIIEQLNAAVPPPGPLLNPEKRRFIDPLPTLTGPEPNIGPVDPTIRSDRQVRAAAESVVKVPVDKCGPAQGTGTGWIARDGIVVTNAHVVQESEEVGVLLEGKGESFDAEPIWFDRKHDVAILNVPGVTGVPALPIDPKPKDGSFAAALGYPGGGRYRVFPARLGATGRAPGLRVEGKRIRTEVTRARARGVRPGSSGGPIVDRRGRVVTMVFAGRGAGRSVVGVPTAIIQRALRRAGRPVSTGACHE